CAVLLIRYHAPLCFDLIKPPIGFRLIEFSQGVTQFLSRFPALPIDVECNPGNCQDEKSYNAKPPPAPKGHSQGPSLILRGKILTCPRVRRFASCRKMRCTSRHA